MLRGEDLQDALVDEAALPAIDPDLLAGPFAHIIVDEAQELTDAEWQMLLLRCPSRSFTIVGDRAQARHGFTESWRNDSCEPGSTGSRWHPEHQLPHPGRDHGGGRTGHPGRAAGRQRPHLHPQHGRACRTRPGIAAGPVLDTWLANHDDGIACVIGDPTFPGTSRVQSLTPELAKGLEFDLVVLVDPETFGDGIEGAVDRYVAMTARPNKLA